MRARSRLQVVRQSQLHSRFVESVSVNRLVPVYLLASFLYYHCDFSMMTDEAYDLCCVRLAKEWAHIKHPHKHIIDFDSLEATTGYSLRYSDYPLIVIVAARQVKIRAESGSNLETFFRPSSQDRIARLKSMGVEDWSNVRWEGRIHLVRRPRLRAIQRGLF